MTEILAKTQPTKRVIKAFMTLKPNQEHVQNPLPYHPLSSPRDHKARLRNLDAKVISPPR
jgi:hypothetical protein